VKLKINCGNEVLDAVFFEETLPNGTSYISVYRSDGTMKNTDKFLVPDNHFFFMGDNRDCSKDSKAQIIFFSNDKKKGSFFKFWKWGETIRYERLIKKIR